MSPLLETFGGASIRGWRSVSLGSGKYFFGIHSAGVNSGTVFVDSSKNIWWPTIVGGTNTHINKVDSNGSLVFQRQTAYGSSSGCTSLATDSSGNYYLSSNTGANVWSAWKINSSNTIQYEKTFTSIGQGSYIYPAVSGNTYVRFTNGGTYSNHYVAKLDSSGAVTWQRQLAITANNDYGTGGLGVDSSENLYTSGYTVVGGTTNVPYVWKYNSSGTIQWQIKSATALAFDQYNSSGSLIDSDSSGNCVAIFNNSNGGGTSAFATIHYFNTSGTLQWSRKLTGTSIGINGTGVKIDPTNGDVYVVGHSFTSTNGSIIVFKYNSAGTIQWQRSIQTGTTLFAKAKSITIDSAAVYVSADTHNSTGQQSFLAKIPKDGSLTGTYTVGTYTVVYGTPSFTDAASGITWVTGTGTDSASAITFNTGSDTLSTPSNTLTTKVIP